MTVSRQASTITPSSTVGDVLERFPESVTVFQRHQRGTSGTCVITREDSIRELCDRLDVPIQELIDDLITLRPED